ncbi:hypothetical protein BDN67DRAFT_970482 [Paxillus ammoniavirescens]|nr:hypothetical protein BDN67DRAFT_970482 [Paxillus ammoniavirescens]
MDDGRPAEILLGLQRIKYDSTNEPCIRQSTHDAEGIEIDARANPHEKPSSIPQDISNLVLWMSPLENFTFHTNMIVHN